MKIEMLIKCFDKKKAKKKNLKKITFEIQSKRQKCIDLQKKRNKRNASKRSLNK
jgi:hypothetical protein